MTTLAYPPQRPLSVGEVLDLSFRIYRATAVKCLLFAALGVLAGQLVNIYAVAKGGTAAKGQDPWQALLTQFADPRMIALYLFGLVLTIIFYDGVLLRPRGGGPPSAGADCARRARRGVLGCLLPAGAAHRRRAARAVRPGGF